MRFRVFSYACSDVGRRRDNNQDSFALARDLDLYVVADGMGGHKGGEVASRMAVEIVEAHLRENAALLDEPAPGATPEDAPCAKLFAGAVQRACGAIYARSTRDPDLDKMGTTTTALLLWQDWAFLAHVGDSRCYLVRDGVMHLLSDDHSLVAEQVRAGLTSEEDAAKSPFRNVITRSVGVEPEVVVDMRALEVRSGDAFLICSDGLTGLVRDPEINLIIGEHLLHRAPEVLVDLANERGGHDNITVVLAYLIDEEELRGVAC